MSYNNSTNTDHYEAFTEHVHYIVQLVMICIGLPLSLVAIYLIYSLVRHHHIVPIYIINLLISDLIQFCCVIVLLSEPMVWIFHGFSYIYWYSEMVSVGFMVCVALERYLVIAHPLWYHFSRSVKMSVLVCVVVWLLPFTYVLPLYFGVDFVIRETIFAIFHLLPLPLFIFFLGGTLKALSAASRVSSDEKRRIVGILVLVLIIYLFLFMPTAFWSLLKEARENKVFNLVNFVLLYFSPLADLVLYVFIRKGAVDKLLACICRCRTENSESSPASGSTRQHVDTEQ